jgi:putative ABC transport system ATP-binding protein
MSVLYDVKNLNFSYLLEGVKFEALKKVNLQVSAGEMVTFAGPSGSGKSTLLNLMGLMEQTQNDMIFYNGKCLGLLDETAKNTIRRFDIGFIFLSFHLFPVLTTYENIEFFLIRQDIAEAKRKELVEESLDVLGISDLRDKRPTQLSGGQRQRVAIARALAKRPKVIIADEPTASLDQKNGEAVVDHLFGINKKFGTTIIVASHDPMVLHHSPKTLYLKDGELQSKAGV